MRTTFHGKLMLLTIVPLAVAQLVTLMAVMRTVESDVGKRARESLAIGGTVIAEYLSSRSEQLRTSVSVVTADFGLKEAVATTDSETIRSVLANHGQRVGADIMLLVDLDGVRIAGTSPLPRTRLERQLAEGRDDDEPLPSHYLESVGADAYEWFAVPLRAPTTIAWIVAGFQADVRLTDRMASLTGLDVTLLDRQARTLVSSTRVASSLGTEAGLFTPGPHLDGVRLIGDKATGYLVMETDFVAGDGGVRVLLLRSLAEAMAPYAEAKPWLFAFSCLLLAAGAAAAIWISGSIARPLRRLTDALRDVISGHYDETVPVTSNDEIGELATNFNLMRTAIAERERHIRHQAQHDPLTNLPNRIRIVEDLDAVIVSMPKATIAIVSLRFTRMDSISSTLGHAASDELIVTAARHLELNQLPGDLLAHVGTHEFVVVLPGQDAADALAHVNKLEAGLMTGVALGRVSIALRTEFGISIYPLHGLNADELLRNAMVARTESGQRGDPVAVYQAGREKHYERQLRIVNDLRSAAEREELHVHYQPKIALPSGAVTGVEALVRWQHRTYGWLPPDEFVPPAEEAGTIRHLTRHVLERAIADCCGWSAAGHDLQVSVNVSARDLQDENLPYYVLSLLRTYGLPAQRLTIEVTENSVMEKLRQSLAVLDCLRDAGVRIAMDDFGTGHSSLAQIRNIPLHELKIDKSFVMTMRSDRHNSAIVTTTLALAKQLGLEVVAEGVEDEDTLRILCAAGCNFGQGYFISKPVAAEMLLEWLGKYQAVSYDERRGENRHFGHSAP